MPRSQILNRYPSSFPLFLHLWWSIPSFRYASRRILIFDLILYFLFILGMTSVILYSTKPLSEAQSPLQPEEQALVSMVLDRFTREGQTKTITHYFRYGGELARRGWRHVSNLTSAVATSLDSPVQAANTAWDPEYR